MPRLPNRDLRANVWHAPNMPPANPDLILMVAKRVYRVPLIFAGVLRVGSAVLMLAERRVDIRSASQNQPGDLVELPAGSGHIYICRAVDDVNRDQASEYRLAVLSEVVFPVPLP